MAFFQSRPDAVYVKNQLLVERWNSLVPHAAGKGERFLEEVHKALLTFGFTEDMISRKEIITRKAAFGNPEQSRVGVLIGRHRYFVFYTAEDYDKHLIVSQITMDELRVQKPPVWHRSIFDREQGAAFLSFADAARIRAFEALAKEANQDVSKLHTESNREGLQDIE